MMIYTNQSVLDAAKERIAYIFDEFESIVVAISGGKDSTVLAHLALEEAHKRGRKIGLFFRDGELIFESVIRQIRYLMNLYPENAIKYWLQIPYTKTISTSLSDSQFVAWDPRKKSVWMREQEPDSLKALPWKPDFYSDSGFTSIQDAFADGFKNTAFLLGLRAEESPNRRRAVSKNPGYKDALYSTRKAHGNVNFYPLYDWQFHDIWRYIWEEKLQYPDIYDFQWLKGLPTREMRISFFAHARSLKSLADLQEFEPDTYERLTRRIKGVQTGALYCKDGQSFEAKKLPKAFKTWTQYRDYLLKTYPDQERRAFFEEKFCGQEENEWVARQQCRQLLYGSERLVVKSKPDPRKETRKKWRSLL